MGSLVHVRVGIRGVRTKVRVSKYGRQNAEGVGRTGWTRYWGEPLALCYGPRNPDQIFGLPRPIAVNIALYLSVVSDGG